MSVLSSPIASPIRSPIYSPTVGKGGGGGDAVSSIFADGTNGFYYNFGTLSKLWKDTAATIPVTAVDDTIARVVDSSPRGVDATQASTPAQGKWQTGGLARLDGSDDAWLTALNPSGATAMTLMGKFKVTGLQKIIMGIAGTPTRCFISTNASGLFSGGIGAQSFNIIAGGGDIRGVLGIGALVFGASTVKLYWNKTEIYSAASSGVPGAAGLAVGGANSTSAPGTVTNFADADFYHILAAQKALTAAQISDITDLWSAS